jgi:hypothetical protein
MGASNSITATNQYQDAVISTTDLKIVNKHISDVTSNVALSSAESCAGNFAVTNNITFTNIDITGNYNDTDISQLQNLQLNFSCINQSTIVNQMQTEMASTIISTMNTMYSTNALNKMDQTLKQKAKTGALATGLSLNNTNTNTDLSTTVDNNVSVNMQNVIKQIVNNNINIDSVHTGQLSALSSNTLNLGELQIDGNHNKISLTQALRNKISEAITNISTINNNIIQTLMGTFGITQSNSATSKIATVGTQSVGQSAASEGIIDALGKVLSDLLEGIIMPLIIVAVILIVAIVGYKYMMASGSAPAPSSGLFGKL